MQLTVEILESVCTEIINNPEKNVMQLSDILNNAKSNTIDIGVVYLAMAKVFKCIAPLYKIRIHSDVIKHKTQQISISNYDKQLFSQYNNYVKEICSSDIPESYKAAAELLRSLDHFNFSDRIAEKVLNGTNLTHPVSNICVSVLIDRIENDLVGDSVSIIIDKCLDCKFSHHLVNAIGRSKYLEKCVQIRIEKEEYYEKEKIESRKLAKKEKHGKGFFAKRKILDKKEKKEEKKRLKLQKEVRDNENTEMHMVEDKNYIKTINALQRLYFTILKEKLVPCFKDVFIGIRQYIRIIRKEFHEGLYTLINEAIKYASNQKDNRFSYAEEAKSEITFSNSETTAILEGMLTIYEVYKNSGIDFKRIIDVYYKMVLPLNYHTEISDYEMIVKIGRCLFISIKQPKLRIIALLQRLMMTRTVRYIHILDIFIKELIVKYDIDLNDHEIKNRNVDDELSFDIDNVSNKPFYEYFLYNKIQ